MSKPIITVFGATGAQGGGLARALLADPGGHFAALHPGIADFATWLASHQARIPLPAAA
jgi:uncharacterized protein YbjT (DUF2867 family)